MYNQSKKLFILLNAEHVKPSFFLLENDLFTFNKYIIPKKFSSKINHKYPNAKKSAIEFSNILSFTSRKGLLIEKLYHKKNPQKFLSEGF